MKAEGDGSACKHWQRGILCIERLSKTSLEGMSPLRISLFSHPLKPLSPSSPSQCHQGVLPDKPLGQTEWLCGKVGTAVWNSWNSWNTRVSTKGTEHGRERCVRVQNNDGSMGKHNDSVMSVHSSSRDRNASSPEAFCLEPGSVTGLVGNCHIKRSWMAHLWQGVVDKNVNEITRMTTYWRW